MSTQQPSGHESKSFMDKFGPQSGGPTPSSASYYQQPGAPASPYSQQPSYQQPSYQQPMYQQHYYVPGIPDEARTYRKASNMCLLLWVLLLAAAFYLAGSPDPRTAQLVTPIGAGSGIMWLAAWCFSMKSKGYSAFLGLLSILGIIGVIVMVLLPNKYKRR